MSKLNKLVKIHDKSPKRVGRGWGSGKGKYAGKGNKGQKSRGKIKWLFDGGQAKLQKRLPMIRGKGKNRSFKVKPFIINVSALEQNKLVKNNDIIDLVYLQKHHLVEKGVDVKILGKGKLTKKLTIKLKMSAKAAQKVKNANNLK